MQLPTQVWPQVFDHVIVSTLAFQIVMAALLLLKGGVVFFVLLLPLPFMFIGLWASAHDLFRRPLRMLSFRAAADIDKLGKMVRRKTVFTLKQFGKALLAS